MTSTRSSTNGALLSTPNGPPELKVSPATAASATVASTSAVLNASECTAAWRSAGRRANVVLVERTRCRVGQSWPLNAAALARTPAAVTGSPDGVIIHVQFTIVFPSYSHRGKHP
eukprot:917401-Prymnesium_polylepis.1